ncbi:uncharacterized protein JCM6883_006564 [Sporobolomyces salmoneus]|uniref:uncharacterized protein n=1 Tax=Sporobolomyces salmoneus TaxID=183962 RepID=UPI00318076CD
MGFDVNDEASLTLFRNEPDLLQFVPSLRICRLPNTFLNFWTVKWLSQIPTLRLVEIDWIRPSTYKMDYDDDRWIPATQVLHVAIRFECRVPTPAQLLQCFPSASFSSVPVLVFEDSNILSLFASLSHGLVSLRLRGSKPDLSSKSIDHLLPQFSNLRHLYLDPAFTSERLQSYLLDVPKLVTLGLGYYEQDLDLDELLSGLGRLPHLWKLTRAYLGIDGSHKYFDFDEAEEEWTHETWMYKINHDTLSLLQNVDDLSDMTDFDLPWRETLSDTLQEVIDLEDKVRAAGLTVEINLSELVQGLGFQIVECYNRAVGDLYYNGRLQPLKYALSIAEKHGFDINRLEISLEEDIDCDKLKWFKDRVGGTGLVAGCYVYGLRFKTDLECYGTEEEEEESDESDQGSGGEHENE